jgi:hypothetical protein
MLVRGWGGPVEMSGVLTKRLLDSRESTKTDQRKQKNERSRPFSKLLATYWSSSPSQGDQYCTGGRATGELCGWVVTIGNSNVQIGSELAQNVATGWRSSCVQSGDSGGSVYTVRPWDQGIAAKGVINSVTPSCYMTFTDLRRVPLAWPGATLRIQ